MVKACFLRTQSLKTDSRLQRTLEHYADLNYELIVIDMCRRGDEVSSEFSFLSDSRYGDRFKNIIFYLKYYYFIFKVLKKNYSQITLIHAIDLDTGIVGFVLSKLFKRPFLYESYDHYADSRELKPRFIFNFLERKLLEYARVAILPDLRRLPQYKISRKEKTLIELKNFNSSVRPRFNKDINYKNSDYITIVYAGVLSTDRYIEKLLSELAGKSNIRLLIAGYGPMERLIKIYERKYENTVFLGKLSHHELLNVFSECDFMYACYQEENPNNKFASPNKYTEHLMLSLPVLTNSGTMFSEDIKKSGTGIVFDASVADLLKIIRDTSVTEYVQMASRCEKVFWRESQLNEKNVYEFKRVLKYFLI